MNLQTEIEIFFAGLIRPIVDDAVAAALQNHQVTSSTFSQATDLLTAEQLRERLDICKASERAYVQAGILKPQHLGRRVFYSWSQVTTAMASTSDQLLPTKLRGRKKTANQI